MTTPRLDLYKPLGTDIVDVTAHLSDQMVVIDEAMGAFECTSTTRPATPFNGQIIFETDTLGILLWESASSEWKLIAYADDTRPRGRMTSGINQTNSALVDSSNPMTSPYISATFNSEEGRKYRYMAHLAVDSEDGSSGSNLNSIWIDIRRNQGGSVNNTHDLVDSERAHFTDQGTQLAIDVPLWRDFTLPSAGEWTVGIFLRNERTSPKMQFNADYNLLVIEDVGKA